MASRPPTTTSMASSASRDSRLYPICNPYSGRMGPDWESIFEPAFRGGLGSHKDDYDNLQRHLKGTDIGGIPPSTAAQVAANAEHLNAFTAHDSGPATADGRKSRRQFAQRSTDVITHLRTHCPVKRIELRIDESSSSSTRPGWARLARRYSPSSGTLRCSCVTPQGTQMPWSGRPCRRPLSDSPGLRAAQTTSCGSQQRAKSSWPRKPMARSP